MLDRKADAGLGLAVLLWLGVCAFGMSVLARYQGTSGRRARPPGRWPAASALRLVPGRDTLLLFVHPHCPCSGASVDSLGWIMSRGSGRVAAYAVFYRPKGFRDGWERTELWDAASEIPGVEVVADPDGLEARRFGAEISGQALLFDGGGKLLFNGGVTDGRGHFGDNAGRDAVRELVAGRPAAGAAPVFGCLLRRAVAEREPAAPPRGGHG